MSRILSKTSLLLSFVSLTLLSCTLPFLVSPGGIIQPNPPKPRGQLVTVPGDATPTATPFQPVSPTPVFQPTQPVILDPQGTPLPTLEPSPTPLANPWGDYPAPVTSPAIEIPPPAGLLDKPLGQINILLLGSDQRPDDGGFRTDTIMLLTVNPAQNTVRLTSFPRDLFVYIPGWTMQRINTAMAYGGFDLLALTFEYNFGVRPDYYVMINFAAFQQTVDSLGGVDVYVAWELTDHRDGYGDYTVPAGLVHMDGETALWYVRSRYTSNDFDRTRRQQEVLQALFQRILSLNGIQRAPELFNIYRQNVTMNLTLDKITALLPTAAQVSSDYSKIQRLAVGPQQVSNWVVPSTGAQVLLPDREAVMEVMRQAVELP